MAWKFHSKRWEEPVVVLEKSLCGIIARWAVQQTPYTVPEGLEEVLAEVRKRFCADPLGVKSFGMRHRIIEADREHLHPYISGLLFDQPQVQAWNRPKIDDGSTMRFISAGDDEDARDPDRDFIDIDALVQNIASSLLGVVK